MLKIISMLLGPVGTNCYFIYKEPAEGDTTAPVPGILIDPADEGDRIYDALTERGFSVELILITHGHFDHIAGADALRKRSGAKAMSLYTEPSFIEDPVLNASEDFGMPCTFHPDEFVRDGETIAAADMSCTVIATPGHTMDGCCFYFAEDGILFAGDTLFQGSVGRTDLPTGSMGTLVRSIREKLFVLPDDTRVYPGHMGPTTIGDEKKYNPFL